MSRLSGWSRVLTAPAVQLSARMLLATRLPVLIIGCVATLAIGLAPTAGRQVSPDPFRNLPARWDATWYMEIAHFGYDHPRWRSGEQQPIVFFPLYPLLMRTVAAVTTPDRPEAMAYDEFMEMRQVHLVWAGVLISLAAFAGALIVLYRWAERHGGPEAARSTVVLLSAYPFAVFFSAPYTESVFLLLVVGACYAFETGRLSIAAALALLAGLTRPNGVMLSVLLGVLALRELRESEPGALGRALRRLSVAAMPVVGLLAYSAYMNAVTGDPFAWMEAQAAWGRDRALTMEHYGWIGRTIREDGILPYVRALPVEALQVVAVLFAFALVLPVWRRVGPAYALFVLANLLPPLAQGGFLSMGRFTSTLFPLFLALALILPAERRTNWAVGFALGQGLVAAMFFTWRPIY